MNSKQQITEIIKKSIVPIAKEKGFRKKSFNFTRHLGMVFQIINIQLSHGNSENESRFYVNIGLHFSELDSEMRVDNLKESSCHFRDRIESLINSSPYWIINEKTETEELIKELKIKFQLIIEHLDVINSLEEYRNHKWFILDNEPFLKIKVFYKLGYFEQAWSEVQRVAELFKDRKNMTEIDIVDFLELSELEERALS